MDAHQVAALERRMPLFQVHAPQQTEEDRRSVDCGAYVQMFVRQFLGAIGNTREGSPLDVVSPTWCSTSKSSCMSMRSWMQDSLVAMRDLPREMSGVTGVVDIRPMYWSQAPDISNHVPPRVIPKHLR